MSEQNTPTLSDNELIAQFMGVQVYSTRAEMNAVPLDKLTTWSYLEQLSYDKEWNEIMPVVEKIQSLGYHTSIYHDADKLTFKYRHEMRIVNSNKIKTLYRELSNGETMIQCVYTAVVDFINWYNSESKHP